MRFRDLLSMSVNSLRRRKLRTFLTVLGVVIGTAAIVVMVSLGIGLKEMQEEQAASWGSLTQITVYSNSRWMEQDSSKEPNYLTDDVVKSFSSLEHVNNASPMLEYNVMMKQGAYEASYVNLVGVNKQYMSQIPLKEGRHVNSSSDELEMIVGNMVDSNFYNPKSRSRSGYSFSIRGGSMSGEKKESNVDFINKPMFVIFDIDKYYQSRGTSTGGDGKPVTPPKKYLIPTVGMIADGENEGGWNDYSYNVYTDIDQLKSQLKKIFKKNPIPGQPTNKKGKALGYFTYGSIIVDVDAAENVTAVQKQITDMGYQANSNMEFLESQQQTSNMIQAVLGGIGAVSLLVAAIGIANTMMMSIYERTKEIGIIKVLGCDMGNIRNMFLIESGFIGLMGGISGALLSYGVSFLMNRFMLGKMMSGMMMGGTVSGNLSRIPPWLSLSAIAFAIVVGMVAGFFPSLRAMKLSPLAAIRNE